jgi:transcriptional regulator with XRE-family HTH domain
VAKPKRHVAERKLPERVIAFMDERGITRPELAKRAGWHEMKVWRVLSGRTPFKIRDIETLARIFEKPMAAFFSDETETAA